MDGIGGQGGDCDPISFVDDEVSGTEHSTDTIYLVSQAQK